MRTDTTPTLTTGGFVGVGDRVRIELDVIFGVAGLAEWRFRPLASEDDDGEDVA